VVAKGVEPVFVVVAAQQVADKRDLLVNRYNELYPSAGRVHWRDGFTFRYFTWRYQFYTAFSQMNAVPDLAFLFDKVPHLRLEGVDNRSDLGVIVKAVGGKVVDLATVGHIFTRSVYKKSYQEVFICVNCVGSSHTFVDTSPSTLRELNLADQEYSLRAVSEFTLTGKNDIDWYIANKTVTNQSGSISSSSKGGKAPVGRGGGNAVGRRVSPVREPANLDRPWKEVVVVDQGAALKALQDQVKLLTEQVSGLTLPK
jgi:hypothetical protein